MKKSLLISFMMLLSAISFAQFTISGELRTRLEYRDGYKTIPISSTKALTIVGQRTRLNFFYQKDKLTTYISLQDARIWGEDKWKSDNNGLGLFEGWAEYRFNKNIALKIGRQPLIYDDQRLFCSGDWRTFAEAHDIARMLFYSDDKTLHFHIGYAINNNGDSETDAFLSEYNLKSIQYKNMMYGHLHKTWQNGVSASIIGVRDGFQEELIEQVTPDPLKVNYRTTFGPYLEYSNNKLLFSGAFYLQRGTSQDNRNIKANFYSGRATYKLSTKNSLTLGYDHYSGTDFSSTNTLTETRTFSTLYGPGHKYLGYMDYFGVPENHGSGINDLLLTVNLGLGKNGSLEATIHQFNLPEGYLKNGIKVDKNLGQELDIVYNQKLDNVISIKAGFSTFFYTQSMEQLKGRIPNQGDHALFGWLMLVVKPSFFSTKEIHLTI